MEQGRRSSFGTGTANRDIGYRISNGGALVSVKHRSLPRVNPDVVWTPVTDGAVLFSVTQELYYGANAVAAFVWQELPTHASFDALCEVVTQRFRDAPLDQIREDVAELLEEF